MVVGEDNLEGAPNWKTNIKDKISRTKDIIHDKGFKDVTAERVEDCLNVLLKNNPDVCGALADLEEIISYLEPGDELGAVMDIFKSKKLEEKNNK